MSRNDIVPITAFGSAPTLDQAKFFNRDGTFTCMGQVSPTQINILKL
jgi:hypothetical protein